MKVHSNLLLTVMLVGSLGAAPSTSNVVAEEGVGSANLEHVLNIPHTTAEGEDGASGSDIEFFEITYRADEVVKRFGAPPVDANPKEKGFQRRFALAGTTGNGMHIYDISEPAKTYRAARYDCVANQGDSQIFTRVEDGVTKTYATYTTEDTRPVPADSQCAADLLDGSADERIGTFVIDISDPFNPKSVAFIDVPEGSHNGSVHPSGDYFYNSNSSLYHHTVRDRGPGIEYYDISDLENIERLGRLPLPPVPLSLGTESHDITFNEDGSRAYSAALSQGVIIDTSDPANPVILTSFVDPTINVWHQSDPIVVGEGEDQRTLLVVEDEVAGAVGTGQCPNGGVHVFDVTDDPAVPEKLGYWNIDEARIIAADGGPVRPIDGTCTAHVFRLYPEQGIMTIAYYNGGVRVVDLGGLAGIGLGENAVAGDEPMVQLAYHRFPDSDAWAAKTPGIAQNGSFWLFSNDLARGLDVYHYDASITDAEAQAQGRWMTPAEAELELTRFSNAELRESLAYSCIFN